MTDVTTLLAGIKTRAEKATEGPWEIFTTDYDYPPVDYSIITTKYGDEVVCFDNHERRAGEKLAATLEDAAFIAAARTDVPRLVAALEAVEKVHEPIDALMNPGRHERVVKVCTGCGTDDGNWQRYPCPTITAVVAALGGGE